MYRQYRWIYLELSLPSLPSLPNARAGRTAQCHIATSGSRHEHRAPGLEVVASAASFLLLADFNKAGSTAEKDWKDQYVCMSESEKWFFNLCTWMFMWSLYMWKARESPPWRAQEYQDCWLRPEQRFQAACRNQLWLWRNVGACRLVLWYLCKTKG